MLPVQLQRRHSYEESQVQLCISLADTVVRTGAENEVVLCALLFRIARVVSLGVELVGILIHFGVAEGQVRAWDDHSTCNGMSEKPSSLLGNTFFASYPLEPCSRA